MHSSSFTSREAPEPGLPLILASRSPRRADLLRDAGYAVECVPSEVDELSEIDGPASALAVANSDAKALSVAAKRADSIVIAADTIVVLDCEIYGKPRDLGHAAEMLGRLSGRVHEVITGVTIVHWARHQMTRFHETTRVCFRRLDEGQIDAYLSAIDPLDKAGAYAAQDDGGRIIERVEGSFTNVVGLPMERTLEILATQFGVIR